jgi:hypothetical protein
MKSLQPNGVTGVICRIKIADPTSTTNGGKTGLAYNTSGLIISTVANNESGATAYTGANLDTITTLGTFGGAAPAANKAGFKEVDATNHPGLYEIQIPNARYAVAGAVSLIITVGGMAGACQVECEYQLSAINVNDGMRAGLSALPNVASGSAGAIPTTGTGSNQIALTGGAVTTGTNNDKSGYALTQTFPTNFSSLAISVGGAITIGTNNDKTGYSLSGSITVGAYAAGQDPATLLLTTPASKIVNDANGVTVSGLTTSAALLVWSALTASMATAGSIGMKLKNWALGTDNKALLSTDAGNYTTMVTAFWTDTTAGDFTTAGSPGLWLKQCNEMAFADVVVIETGSWTANWYISGTGTLLQTKRLLDASAAPITSTGVFVAGAKA